MSVNGVSISEAQEQLQFQPIVSYLIDGMDLEKEEERNIFKGLCCNNKQLTL